MKNKLFGYTPKRERHPMPLGKGPFIYRGFIVLRDTSRKHSDQWIACKKGHSVFNGKLVFSGWLKRDTIRAIDEFWLRQESPEKAPTPEGYKIHDNKYL